MNTRFYGEENLVKVLITETKKVDEWTTVVDLKPLGNAIKGLELLGKSIDFIFASSTVSVDFDTPYYHRFSEEMLNRLYNQIRHGNAIPLTFKNNRLYFQFENKEIICPEGMRDLYSNIERPELTISFRY